MRPRSLAFSAGWWVLLVGFVMQVPLGLSVALGYGSPLWGWHRHRMARSLLGLDDVPAELMPMVDQLTAMLGATMACWGLAMAVLVWVPLRQGKAWAWWCIAASAGLWFVVDTGLSAAHGATVNVAFNSAAGLMMGIPLVLTAGVLRRAPAEA